MIMFMVRIVYLLMKWLIIDQVKKNYIYQYVNECIIGDIYVLKKFVEQKN